MLEPRQIELIMVLLNHDEWCSGEMLCNRFRLTRKTLQGEISRIQNELANGLELEVSHRGYRISALTGEARERVWEQLLSYGENRGLSVRATSILLYIFYLKDFISMRELAEIFYLSKTAIAMEVETIRGWLEASDGVKLEVSGSKGIRVTGSEAQKRTYIARIANLKAFHSLPLEGDPAARIVQLMADVFDVLEEQLPMHDFIVSGKDYRILARYIATTVVRSRLGLVLEPCEAAQPLPDIIGDIADGVEKKTGYCMTAEEKRELFGILWRCDTFSEPGGSVESHPMREKLITLDKEASKILALPEDFRFGGRQYELQFLERVHRCYNYGITQLNDLDSDTVLEYPLEMVLATRLIPKVFGKETTEETSAMALFLGSNLRAYRNSVSVVLVTNENPAVAYQILRTIRSIGNPTVRKADIIPEYAYRHEAEKYSGFEVRLTTEPRVRLMDERFYYIPAVLSEEEIDTLAGFLRKRRDTLREESRRKMEKLFPIENVRHEEKVAGIETLLGEKEKTFQSFHVVRDRILYVCRMGAEEKMHLTLHTFQIPLSFRHRKISKLLLVSCREQDEEILQYFEYVSQILKSL